MDQAFIDNKASIMKDELAARIAKGDKMSVAASLFSMYAYSELKEELEGLDEFRFVFTSDAFTKDRPKKEQREFYIPRMRNELGLFGSQFEVKLKNELTQKAIASECAEWIKEKAKFKSYSNEGCSLAPTAQIEKEDDVIGYMPFVSFDTVALGIQSGGASPSFSVRQDSSMSKNLLDSFNQEWDSGKLVDVTDSVIDNITLMYRENPPELIYYLALYRVFHEFLEDVSGESLPDESSSFKETKIWSMLYDFQKDAVVSIVQKLNRYNGCILADSVGLGKTFTALAVMAYYLKQGKRKARVLVLCPKRLSENWTLYNHGYKNNPLRDDDLHYDVLYHTDLSRKKGMTETGIDLARLDWSNYDLVVIDESHNFRNGEDTSSKEEGKRNRYQRLVEEILQQGERTRVLMLSATPVNNRFRDIRNQLALVYQGESQVLTEKLGLEMDIDSVFRMAQSSYSQWAKRPIEERTTESLTQLLTPDFFHVLDQMTVARSRKHIQRYYDANAIGPFPKRRKPITQRPGLSKSDKAPTYGEIAGSIELLSLAVYSPSRYLQPSRAAKYADKNGNLTMGGRETGVKKLMGTNLLKRLESSVHSFRLTLQRILGVMNQRVAQINEYERLGKAIGSLDVSVDENDFEPDDLDALDFEVGGKQKFDIADLDWKSWRRDMMEDIQTIEGLLYMVEGIDPASDEKLGCLRKMLCEKVQNPINAGNRKAIIFTAFADTADYIYDNLVEVVDGLGLSMAEVTGGTKGSRTTANDVPRDMNDILTCFSPESKGRDKVMPGAPDIDILVATDCISEGQNLQDCDYLVNYDIHWNPVRIVQRFGRIDRIGSKNAEIQLVNFWPDIELDDYINLKNRVESRMRGVVLTSTGDDDLLNEDEKGDLEYRKNQLLQMQNEVVDLEDVDGGVSITDLGLNDFRSDLAEYYKAHPEIERTPSGINAVVQGDKPGIAFVLKNVSESLEQCTKNQIHPFYVVHVSDDGSIVQGYLKPKQTLDYMRQICKGKATPDDALCRAYNKETRNGRDMRKASELLACAIESIVEGKSEEDVDSFFTAGNTSFLESDIAGVDDFELVCFLVVRAC